MSSRREELEFRTEGGAEFLRIGKYWLGTQSGYFFAASEFDKDGNVTRSDVSVPDTNFGLFLTMLRVQQIASNADEGQLRRWAKELGLAS